jgi:hypothetical protein
MVIANIVGAKGVDLSKDPVWPHIDNWAAELGLSGANAVTRVSVPPVLDGPAPPGKGTAEPFGGARLCAYADRDRKGAHWLPPGETYQAETSQEPEAGT